MPAGVCDGGDVDEDLWDAYDRMGLSFEQHAADSAYNAHYDRPAVLAAGVTACWVCVSVIDHPSPRERAVRGHSMGGAHGEHRKRPGPAPPVRSLTCLPWC